MQAGVAIASLLSNSGGKCSYDIYCVLSKYVTFQEREELKFIVEKFDPASTIAFLNAGDDISGANTKGAPIGTYYRLLLPTLLPDLDKIIYLDVDIVVCTDLIELNGIDMGGNLLAGVKDILNYKTKRTGMSKPEEYINAGILLINLKEIRTQDLYSTWIKLSKTETFKYYDQDILNITCQNRIVQLPLKFNFYPGNKNVGYKKAIKSRLHTKREFEEAMKFPVILHYIYIKPWDKRTYLSHVWWEYAKKTPFYLALAANYYAHNYISPSFKVEEKRIYLFGFIHILSIVADTDKVRYKLFGCIPILKIKIINN
jgi:lipopolysaccharide biosynthesis glycosyltransferase